MEFDAFVEIGEMFYVWGSASLSLIGLNGPGFTSDITTYLRSVGVGMHRAFADNLSIYGEFGILGHKVEYRFLPHGFHLEPSAWVDEENAIRETDTATGWIASGGLRAMLTDHIELFGSLTHRDVENDGLSTLSGGVEVRIYRGLGLRASVFLQEESNGYGLGVVWRR